MLLDVFITRYDKLYCAIPLSDIGVAKVVVTGDGLIEAVSTKGPRQQVKFMDPLDEHFAVNKDMWRWGAKEVYNYKADKLGLQSVLPRWVEDLPWIAEFYKPGDVEYISQKPNLVCKIGMNLLIPYKDRENKVAVGASATYATIDSSVIVRLISNIRTNLKYGISSITPQDIYNLYRARSMARTEGLKLIDDALKEFRSHV